MPSKVNFIDFSPFKGLACFVAVVLVQAFAIPSQCKAQSSSSTMTKQEKEIYRTSPGQRDEDNIFNAVDPIDLMNRIRRATAMDNATSPEDAIDAALKAFEAENLPSSPQ